MSETVQIPVAAAIERMGAALAEVSEDARKEKALYHLERLGMAFTASHQEAVRFAAFTLNKTVRDAAADWGPAVTAAMASLASSLQAAGHHF